MYIKRLFAFILIMTLMSLALFTSGLGTLADYQRDANPFSYYDRLRQDSLKGINQESRTSPKPMPGKDTKAYIISFKDDASLNEIYDSVSIYDFELLAFSSERMFLIYLENVEEFVSDNSSIIDYAIPDRPSHFFFEEELLGVSVGYWELNAIEADEELTSGGNGVVVAILDSGINRSHPQLAEADILEGYNAVTGQTGVDGDDINHGTKITGIIVSSVSGIARGATILPVKITTDGRSILTSSLVSGIYYAADYGADVINMSFGGYDENKAERDAVEYALEKGCILVAAAGNEGRDMGYAGKPAYPASYDGVISVASSRQNGEPCGFSQFNEFVDIAAPGEDLTVVSFLDDEPVTVSENGTSYSTAFVSGAAALVVYNSPRKLDSRAFGKLLEYSAVTPKSSYLGWGVLNLPRLMDNLSKPAVLGVSNGGIYFEEVMAFFTDAAATLDGEEYLSGESIYSQGSHTLIVTDRYGSVTLNFTVDLVRLNYNIKRNGDHVVITFLRGKALVDGQPYESGDVITGFGQHTFVLTGPYGNTVSETFFISSDIPALFGVSDGKIYNNRVLITVIGDGYSFLDGVGFKESIIVTAPGQHTLLRTDYEGVEHNETTFYISDTGIENFGVSPGGKVICNEVQGWVAFWDINEKGIKIYRQNDLSKIQRYIPTDEKIISLSLDGGKLFAVTEQGYAVYDTSLLVSSKNPFLYEFSVPFTVVNGMAGGGYVFLVSENGTVYSYVQGTENNTELDTLSSETSLFSNGQTAYAYSVYYPKTVYVFNNGMWGIKSPEEIPGGEGIFATQSLVLVGDMAYDPADFSLKYQINGSDRVVYCDDNVFIAGKRLYSSRTGEIMGIYPGVITAAYRDGGKMYLAYSDKTLERVKPGGMYGASPANNAIAGNVLLSRAFEYTVPLDTESKILNAAYDENSGFIGLIRNGDNKLYFLNPVTWAAEKAIHLKYVPSSLTRVQGGIAVLFSKVNKVYLSQKDEYISFPARVSSVCMWEGRLFAVCGGKVCEYIFATGETVYPFGDLNADGVACNGGKLYVSTVYDLTGYDINTLTPFAVKQAMYSGNVAANGNYVIAGNAVYDADTLDYVTAVIGRLFDFQGNSLLTETGLFSLPDGKYVSGYMSSPANAVILPDFTTLLFNEMAVIAVNSEGFDPVSAPVVTGVEEGNTYYGGVSVGFDRGTAYVDGKKIQNGYTEKKAGKHTLTVVSAWNVYRVINFSVKYEPESVVIQNGDVWLGVGQSATLRGKILPEGAEGTVIFSTDSGNITVTPAGVVTALSPGEGIVKAEVAGTTVNTFCTVYVTDYSFICTNKDYIIDEDNDIIYGVLPGTEVNLFLSSFVAQNCSYTVTNAAGVTATEGYVTTGMYIKRYDLSGKLTKSLVISVKGDLDGDGTVSLNDADMLYRHLLQSTQLEKHTFRSADCNINSRVTSTDLKVLNSMLDYSVKGKPGNISLYVNIPLFGYTGSEFYVTIQNDRLDNAISLAGVIEFDQNRLSVSRIITFGGEITTTKMPGRLEYSILGTDSFPEKSKLLRVYFSINKNSPTGETSIRFTDTAAVIDGLYGIADNEDIFVIKNTPAEGLTVTSDNALLEFDEKVAEYNLVIPEGEDYLKLDFDCPAGCYIYFNNLPLYNGQRRLTLVYINQSGDILEYFFNVTRGEVYIPDGNSGLLSLEVLGAEITPEFDSEITEYSAETEYGVQTSIIALPAGKNAEVEITGPDILTEGENLFTVTCTAEDGSRTVYTLTITMLPPGEESGEESDLSSEEYSESSQGETSREESELSFESSQEQSRETSSETSRPFEFTLKTLGYLLVASGILTALGMTVVLIVRRKRK